MDQNTSSSGIPILFQTNSNQIEKHGEIELVLSWLNWIDQDSTTAKHGEIEWNFEQWLPTG